MSYLTNLAAPVKALAFCFLLLRALLSGEPTNGLVRFNKQTQPEAPGLTTCGLAHTPSQGSQLGIHDINDVPGRSPTHGVPWRVEQRGGWPMAVVGWRRLSRKAGLRKGHIRGEWTTSGGRLGAVPSGFYDPFLHSALRSPVLCCCFAMLAFLGRRLGLCSVCLHCQSVGLALD